MLQIYYGDGKGKTSAAVGAAVRAAGAGLRVRFVQFFKNGDSSEIAMLRRIGIDCRVPDRPFALGERIEGRVQAELTASYNRLLRETAEAAASVDLVVLDEGLDALALNLMDGDVLAQMLDRPNAPEVILTGHTAVPDWMNRADYLTQMRAERHPYVRGISARKGIEW